MQNLQLVSVWSALRPQGTYIRMHSHHYYELVYYPFGKGETTVGGETYRFFGQTFVLIPPQVPHDERHAADSKVICLVFSGAEELPQHFGEDPLRTVYRLLCALLREVREQAFGYETMLSTLLTALLVQLQRERSAGGQEKSFVYMMNYLRENFHEKIRLSDCAAQLNLSYDYFQHRFKAIAGESPQRFLLRQRLEAAAGLLRETDLSCTEIAYRCGFSTSAQCSALFKREYGRSPLQFRREQRGKEDSSKHG